MDRVTLGSMETSAMGLGCLGMSGFYGAASWDDGVATIRRAVELGVTLIDTADVYGAGHNEVLVGRAVVDCRAQVQIATKVGIDRSDGGSSPRLRGDAAYVNHACDASLARLGVDEIDLYYLHKPPENVDIEEAVGALAELVRLGKVRHIGLCEVDDAQLRRAHAVHPVTAVQSEYSLWTRDPETRVVDAMRELGVGLVPYSPLGRGFLTATVDLATLSASEFRSRNPRFIGAAGRANLRIAETVRRVADRYGVTAAQVALAWVLGQASRLGIDVVPIPGTKRVAWLEQNVAAESVILADADAAELDRLGAEVVGSRY